MPTVTQYKSPYAEVSQTMLGDKENQLPQNTNNQNRTLQFPGRTIYRGATVNMEPPYGDGVGPDDNEKAANVQKLPGYSQEHAVYEKTPQQLQEKTRTELTWVKLNARIMVPGTACYKIKSGKVSASRRAVEKKNGRMQDIQSPREISRILPRLNPENSIFKSKIRNAEDQRTVGQSDFELKVQASKEAESTSDAESCKQIGALIL